MANNERRKAIVRKWKKGERDISKMARDLLCSRQNIYRVLAAEKLYIIKSLKKGK